MSAFEWYLDLLYTPEAFQSMPHNSMSWSVALLVYLLYTVLQLIKRSSMSSVNMGSPR